MQHFFVKNNSKLGITANNFNIKKFDSSFNSLLLQVMSKEICYNLRRHNLGFATYSAKVLKCNHIRATQFLI